MKLSEYMHTIPWGTRDKTREEFAERLGVSIHTFKSWEKGLRKVNPIKARELEILTGGEVTKHELCPGVFLPSDK